MQQGMKKCLSPSGSIKNKTFFLRSQASLIVLCFGQREKV